MAKQAGICMVEHCIRSIFRRGVCNPCYQVFRMKVVKEEFTWEEFEQANLVLPSQHKTIGNYTASSMASHAIQKAFPERFSTELRAIPPFQNPVKKRKSPPYLGEFGPVEPPSTIGQQAPWIGFAFPRARCGIMRTVRDRFRHHIHQQILNLSNILLLVKQELLLRITNENLMPFKSEKQRKYLCTNEPDIARKWTDEEQRMEGRKRFKKHDTKRIRKKRFKKDE